MSAQNASTPATGLSRTPISDMMDIDGQIGPPPSTTIYNFNNVITSHERLWPDNKNPIVPYAELPDHRPTQENLPPMTVAFRRPHVVAKPNR